MELQWCYIYTPASALSTSRSNEDLKLLDGLTPQTRCICDKRMEILNRRDQMRGLTPNILPHSPHMLPQQTKFQEIGNSDVAIRAETCRQKHPRLNMTRSCANLAKGLPCEWPVWTRATRIAMVSLHPFLWSPMDTLAHRVIVIH